MKVQEKIEEILYCTPPYLIRESLRKVCNGRLNVTENEMTRVGDILINDVINNEKSTNCLQPCKEVTYKPKLQYVSSRSEENLDEGQWLGVKFDSTVLVQRSSFSVGTQTLLTRLGGYIGGGRTLFWLVIAFFGLFKYVQDFVCWLKHKSES